MSLNIPVNTQQAIFEALKEASRWLLFFVISWIITETLEQITLVPESAELKVWVFTYVIPVRYLFQFCLTMAGRAADKFVHEWNGTKLKGILPF